VFQNVAERNIEHLGLQKKALAEAGHINRGHYTGHVQVKIADSAADVRGSAKRPQYDILVTSPPYGDNTTTVPYGQHSYLPLQWIDLADISPELDGECLKTTHEIDRRSLGGSRKNVKQVTAGLRDKSPHLAETLDALKNEPLDRSSRVIAFCRDLEKCVAPTLAVMRPHAVMIWILGNRRVGGRAVPLDLILSDFLIEQGARSVTIIKRDIPSKRMAIRNSVSATMRSESIVVLRKGCG
jgi:hypothetical protein